MSVSKSLWFHRQRKKKNMHTQSHKLQAESGPETDCTKRVYHTRYQKLKYYCLATDMFLKHGYCRMHLEDSRLSLYILCGPVSAVFLVLH